MKRRSLAGVALAAGLALTLSACGSETPATTPAASNTPAASASAPAGSAGSATNAAPDSSAAPTTDAPAASGEAPDGAGATLTIWADDTRSKPLAAVAKKFEAETGAKVNIVQKDFAKMRDDFISQAPTGKGPDVVVGAHDWLGKLVQNGVVAPLELGDKAADFSKVTVDALSLDGKTYGLPYAFENIALIRNTKLAPEAPKTFQEAVTFGQQLVKDKKAKYPFLIQQDPKNGDPYHMYPVQTSFGAPVFGTNADGSYNPDDLQMNNDGGKKFADYLAELGKAGVLKDTINYDIATKAFAKGESPYIISGPWATGGFTEGGVDFVVEKVPSAGGEDARPFVGVQGFFVSSKSKSDLLAKEFVLNYLSTEEVQLALFEAGDRPPALTSAFDKVKSDPIVAGFGEVGANGVPMPSIPAMDAVWADWGAASIAIVQGKGNPAELWGKAAASIEKKIAG